MGSSLSRTKKFIPADYRSKPGEASNAKSILLSKENLDFGHEDKHCPIGQTLHDEISIKNRTTRSLKFKFEPIVPKTCTMSFEPSLGTLKKEQNLTVRFNLVINSPENYNFKVTLRVEGDEAHFIGVRLRCDTGVFGCDPSTLEQATDNGFTHNDLLDKMYFQLNCNDLLVGYHVPLILVQMKRSLVDHDGLSSEGIFRIGGETAEVKRLKQEMNKKQFKGDPDVNSIASLMKIWFRELPTPLLNAVPPDIIMNSHEHQLCIDTFAKLPEPQKTLMNWLTDLLLDFAANSAINKMTAQNLAIVVAPNLYEPPSSDPMQGLVLSQKCVQFFYHIMMDKQGMREEAAKRRQDNHSAVQGEAQITGNRDSNESINDREIKPNPEQEPETNQQLQSLGAAEPRSASNPERDNKSSPTEEPSITLEQTTDKLVLNQTSDQETKPLVEEEKTEIVEKAKEISTESETKETKEPNPEQEVVEALRKESIDKAGQIDQKLSDTVESENETTEQEKEQNSSTSSEDSSSKQIDFPPNESKQNEDNEDNDSDEESE